MPTIYLLVQVTELSYITDVLEKLDEKIRNRFAKRILVITKNTTARQIRNIKKALKNLFKGFDVQTQHKDLGSSFSGPNYETACRIILEQIKNEILTLNDFYNQELVDFEEKIR